MSTFSKALKYRKPSHGINERIRFLNRQLMKFSENNTTAGVYSVVDTTSATAMIPPVVSAVPDTSGITNYSTFSQATNGGSNSDDSTWDTGWNSISQLYNSNTLEYDQQYLPILNNPWNTGDEDGNYGILGWETVHGNINFSTLTGANYHGSFDSGSPEEIAFDNACGTTPGINSSGWIPWRVWEQYSLWNPRIDSYLPIPEHEGQYPKWTGPFKKVGSTYYCLVGSWRLYAGAAGEYISQHAVKGYGAFTTLLDRWSLDDANYYPGNPAQSMYSYLDVGPYGFHQALDESASYSDDEWLNDWLWGSSSDTTPGVFSWSNYSSSDDSEYTSTGVSIPPEFQGLGFDQVDIDALGELAINKLLKPLISVAANNPNASYAVQIAGSIAQNAPIVFNNDDISMSDKKNYIQHLNWTLIMNGGIPINNEEQIVSDGNFHQTTVGGDFQSNQGPNGEQGYNTPDQTFETSFTTGNYGENPLGSSGKNQAQIVFPEDGGVPYFTMTDLIYNNQNSPDSGEVPSWAQDGAEFINNHFGKGPDEPNTGDMEFAPAGINGLVIKNINVPIPQVLQWDPSLGNILLDATSPTGPQSNPQAHEYITNLINQQKASKVVSEKKDPLRGKDQWFNADDIKPEYPNDPPPEMKGGWHPKLYDQKPNPMVSLERKKRKKEPYIKITEKDLLKNHKLKEEERKVMIKLIGQLNRWIDDNPGRIEYIRERYPKNDPRLAMLNYKLDKREEASKKYMETHFPENKSVFERIKRMTRKNIEATQPHRFKSVINPPTYNDYDSHVVMPKLNTHAADTIKIKESFTKHFKKPVRLKSWHKGHLSSS